MPEPATRSFTVPETSSSLSGFVGDACADVDGEPGEFVVDEVALACVEADADAEAEVADRIADGAAAADRQRGPVEAGCEEAVPGRVDLATAELANLASHGCVVLA
jgi:hypothetical protein